MFPKLIKTHIFEMPIHTQLQCQPIFGDFCNVTVLLLQQIMNVTRQYLHFFFTISENFFIICWQGQPIKGKNSFVFSKWSKAALNAVNTVCKKKKIYTVNSLDNNSQGTMTSTQK